MFTKKLIPQSKVANLKFAAVTAAVLLSAAIPMFADMDSDIESSFVKTYVYKTYLKNEHIKINSKDGVVTLSGDVMDESHKPMAQDTAEALSGVKSVKNDIVVKGEMSDTWIEMKVQSALIFHANVSSRNTEVISKDGVVTLKGEASSQAQKELTTEYAKGVNGVKRVNNEMKVVNKESVGEKIDDASITAQVKMALLVRKSTGAIRTTVVTKDSVVTVSGKAKNDTERDLVTKLAEDVQGVDYVVNKMTIE